MHRLAWVAERPRRERLVDLVPVASRTGTGRRVGQLPRRASGTLVRSPIGAVPPRRSVRGPAPVGSGTRAQPWVGHDRLLDVGPVLGLEAASSTRL